MSPTVGLLVRYGTGLAVAGALLALVHPGSRPAVPLAVAPLLGLAAGLAVFAAAERGVPRLRPPSRRPLRGWVAAQLALALWAGVEETVWRHAALGSLIGSLGAPAAVAVTAVGFALAHRRPAICHLLAGVGFGGVYVVSGRLAAAWAAHVAYNLAVALRVEAEHGRPPVEAHA